MSFALDVSKFVEKAKKNPEKVMRQVSIKLFSAIIKASPVDTGRFRMNWMASGSTPADGTTDATDKSGNTATGNATSFVLNAADWHTFTLTNNLPYAQRLEYGWSQQAPQGFVRVNVSRFQQLLNEEASKVK
ncbi:HK97 gp10 family phage protein [Salmonella enterica subsp. enterica serovar Enteritidis]|nr:HK97 gp10 family phage protein [Salmonella enterica subsp. enterica serovar Enteritidis]EDK3356869.1 HK97 gp10 family phage protein [Salmonella enterica subsp. enterica serovar Enteritidis]EKB7558753.1 HK97 gp10 family phage protein [Salmonella enterica]